MNTKKELAQLSLNLFDVSVQHPQALDQAVKVGLLAKDFNNEREQPKLSNERRT